MSSTSDTSHAAGDAAGHDQPVGAPLTRPSRRVAAPLLDIGHDSSVLPQTNKVLIQVPERRYVLFYDYVEDILERRIPHREAHLAALRAAMEDGRVVDGGPAWVTLRSGAAIVFAAPDAAEAFASADPYVINGLVTDRRVELLDARLIRDLGRSSNRGRNRSAGYPQARCRFRRPACVGCARPARCAASCARPT